MSAGPADYTVRHGGGSYTVRTGSGILAELPGRLEDLLPGRDRALISDDRVLAAAPAWLEAPAWRARFSFPAGEASKTVATWAALSDRLLEAGFARNGAVVALGGGVTGDLAGFVAATYMRGIPVVQVPTSLLAMIDASIGGKVGVNTARGKNLIGAFHPPVLVLADTRTLTTLPEEEYRAGLAEAVKHGLVADAEYFRLDRVAGGRDYDARSRSGARAGAAQCRDQSDHRVCRRTRIRPPGRAQRGTYRGARAGAGLRLATPPR